MNGKIDPVQAASLRIIAAAMGGGIALLTAMIAYFYFQNRIPATPQGVALINRLTATAMGATAAAVVASQVLWKSILSGSADGDAGKTLVSAFIARTACREGAALLGCVTALLAALNGVLRANPVYWLNLAPAVLFWAYLYVHWPSVENLEAELAAT